MDETATRRKKIDPKLCEVGWESVPQSVILTEQRAYEIAPGRITRSPNKHPKKADYILEYRGKKLAVIEAKSDEKDVAVGVEQAKLYADMLQIRYTYSTNGDEIWFIDMGVKDSRGNYVIPSTEYEVDKFPSPQELWQMTYPTDDVWRDKFNLCPLNRAGGRMPRYYQEIAINNVLSAVAKEQRRILLTMATGTGKTYTAFQICWKLTKTKWNTKGLEREPRILFIADRNILANQAVNDFEQFEEDAMCRVTPAELKKNGYKVPTARNLYFTIFQTMMTSPKAQREEESELKNEIGKWEIESDNEGVPYFMQYPRDFFDFVIIDECHRGGANDESEWRRIMDYFDSAYQLGMTATPRRTVNANTYNYFGEPVYTYSLKQGIEDGFLVPFRVDVSTSNIDDYRYEEGDIVRGEIDKDRTYTEKDFYNGNIKMKDRDEHRVKEFLQKIDPDEKTIVFCATQEHAMIVRDLVNKHKRRADSDYCKRVTADDGKDGEDTLKLFQNNEKRIPTILTTSQKLSTGVDARNVRNIVLMRPVNNMVEFKQIIGRGTRLFDDKYYFTIYDFVGAHAKFEDPDWDGEQYCPDCGNWSCTCHKAGSAHDGGGYVEPEDDSNGFARESVIPEACPVCGHLPCTCDGSTKRPLEVRLSATRKLQLHTSWSEMIYFGDRLITMKDFVRALFGRLPDFFSGADDLREQWSNPDTRESLLSVLDDAGFGEERLEQLKKVMKLEKCDLFDVLEHIAYETTPIERVMRAEIVKQRYLDRLSAELRAFDQLILENYVANGFKELRSENLKTFIKLRYSTPKDAQAKLNMTIPEMRQHYFTLQRQLYAS